MGICRYESNARGCLKIRAISEEWMASCPSGSKKEEKGVRDRRRSGKAESREQLKLCELLTN